MSSVKQQDLLSAMVNALRVSIITIEVATILNHTVIQLYGRRQAIGQLVSVVHVGLNPRTEVRKSCCISEGSTGGGSLGMVWGIIVYFSMLSLKGVRHSKCMV